MPQALLPENEFRLGITMAGAISAGCYTGGVMDYLFEILDLWQKAKDGNTEDFRGLEHLIPKHKVIIEAMGGASAGGMTTTMAAIYALNGNINPVKYPGKIDEIKNNLFYDSWVTMDDSIHPKGRLTFEKLWDCDDLNGGVFQSFLNSSFVDRIAESVFSQAGKEIEVQTASLPAYISQDLQMILSHTLLRGVPLEVDFQTPIARTGRKTVLPNHTTYEHYTVSHFHLNKGSAPNKHQYLFLNPYQQSSAETMKLATMATGAFPLGLMYRKFDQQDFSDDYYKTIFKRIISGKFGEADPDPDQLIKLKYFPEKYSSLTVDGGAINNEPYREVMSLLSNKYGIPAENQYPSYGVIMIDPFPDQASLKGDFKEATDLLDMIPDLLDTLQDQSRVKRREMLESDPNTFFRSIIFPRKWKVIDKEKNRVKPEKHPIACASVGAFGGLFDVKFRQHDFFLGRDNARNFLRYYFSMPYDPDQQIVHPIHKDWSAEMVAKFKIEKDGKTFLPIIPDLYLLKEDAATRVDKRYQYTVGEKPFYDTAPLFESSNLIQKRLLRIMDIVKERKYISQKEEKGKISQALIAKHYKKKRLSKWGGWLAKKTMNLVYLMGRKPAAKALTEKIIKFILADLDYYGLLQEEEKNKAG
jgi:hypothetical protein